MGTDAFRFFCSACNKTPVSSILRMTGECVHDSAWTFDNHIWGPLRPGGPGIAAAGGGSQGFPQSGGTLSPDPDRSLRSGALLLEAPPGRRGRDTGRLCPHLGHRRQLPPPGQAYGLAAHRGPESGSDEAAGAGEDPGADRRGVVRPARPGPRCHHGGPPRPPRRPFRPVRAGAAGGHAPCGHRPEAPGDRPAAGAPPCHSPVQIPLLEGDDA